MGLTEEGTEEAMVDNMAVYFDNLSIGHGEWSKIQCFINLGFGGGY